MKQVLCNAFINRSIYDGPRKIKIQDFIVYSYLKVCARTLPYLRNIDLILLQARENNFLHANRTTVKRFSVRAFVLLTRLGVYSDQYAFPINTLHNI